MDTSVTPISTDSLGRRTGPLRRRTAAEKRRIVEESFRPGASVAVIARRYEVNANSLFGWRRKYGKGRGAEGRAQLLPVSVTDERPTSESSVELQLAGGTRICAQGDLARELVRQLIQGMLAR